MRLGGSHLETYMSELESIILTALCVPHGDPRDEQTKIGLPLILWGNPGIRKSETVEAVAKFLGFFLATVFPSTSPPEDFGGIPVPDGKGKVIRMCPIKKVHELCDIGEGVLFIDEATTVPAAVQAALMGVVLNRTMGDLDLPPKVRPILAANPPETSAGGHDAITTLANRCCHVEVEVPTVSEWLDWNFDRDVSRKKLPASMFDAEKKVRDSWDLSFSQAKALVSGFLQSTGQSMLYSLPEVGHPDRNRAFRTPRTWNYAQNALATSLALKSGEGVEDALITGCVGNEAGLDFRKWRKLSDLPTPQDMLANGWTPDKQRLDRSMYAYSALCGYVSSLPAGDTKIRAGGKTYNMLKEACEAGIADLLYRSATELVKSGLMPSTMVTQDHVKAAEYVLDRFKKKSAALRQLMNTP
jgi:hypothetical protein